jgi:HD-GYP domain-containing protein (c-di-GMP phosphodiesterase class II)
MTDAPGPQEPKRRSSIAGATEATDTELRHTGARFLKAFHAALRSLELYPLENERAQTALDELTAAAAAVTDRESELEVRLAGQLLFINGTRLRIDLRNYASFGNVLSTFEHSGIGTLNAMQGVERREWQEFVLLLVSYTARDASSDLLAELQGRMVQADVTRIAVGSPVEGGTEVQDQDLQKDAAKRTYEHSVAITNELAESARMGRSASVKEVKRAVQGIVDQILDNELALLGLTTIRDYDDYTFTHSVNVSIFSVAIGKRLGLSKEQLYDLGMAAFLHDVGKARIPKEVVTKTGPLAEDEWQMMQRHPTLGAITLFGFRGYGEIPYRSMITAYEHHMKKDLTGYPKALRPRELSIYSKIVMVADVYDAATSKRVYRSRAPLLPREVLGELLDDHERLGINVAIVKALISLLGIYPVGSCVVLDSHEVALVHGANPDPSQSQRPLVRLIYAPNGSRHADPPIVDLAAQNADGSYQRTIVKVTDPEKFGVNPRDYYL